MRVAPAGEADGSEAKQLLTSTDLKLEVLVIPGKLGATPISSVFNGVVESEKEGLNARAVAFRVWAADDAVIRWTPLGPTGDYEPRAPVSMADLRRVLGKRPAKPRRKSD